MSIKIPEPRYDYDAEDLAFRYKQAVEQIMNKLVTTDPKGYSKAFQMAQLKEIADILSELNDESKKWVEEHIPEAVREGSAVTLYVAGIVGSMEQARKLVKFSALNERMVEAVIADTQGDLLAVTQNVERRVRNQIRAVSADVMRRNMAAGINGTRTNKREILTDLRSRLESALDTGIVDAAGRRWKPDVYVKMLVQTKMMYAHTEGTTNEALERGIQYATISSHGATDACRQWEGKVVKLVPEAPGSYPTVAEAKASRQIFHPNCKHLIVPIRDPARLPLDDQLPENNADPQTPKQKLEQQIQESKFDPKNTSLYRDMMKERTVGKKFTEFKETGDFKHAAATDIYGDTTVDGLMNVFNPDPSKYSVKMTVTAKEGKGYNESYVSVRIHDKDDREVGRVRRTIVKKDGEIHVHNDLFELEKDIQGDGIARNVYFKSEQFLKYIAKGAPVHINMTANLDVGVYAWARYGFDFADPWDIETMRSRVSDHIGELLSERVNAGEFGQLNVNITREQWHNEIRPKVFNEELKKMGYSDLNEIQHSWQIAALDDGQEHILGWNKRGHLGKKLMLNFSMWEGKKSLNTGSASELIGLLYYESRGIR